MDLPSRQALILNGAAGLITVVAVIAVVRSFITTPTIPSCAERYRNVMLFPLERDGALLTPADLQSRVGKESGLLENVEITISE